MEIDPGNRPVKHDALEMALYLERREASFSRREDYFDRLDKAMEKYDPEGKKAHELARKYHPPNVKDILFRKF